jgi:hypothetical protein
MTYPHLIPQVRRFYAGKPDRLLGGFFMKKALVVLLILAVAGGVFAQDLVWSGKVETGLNITEKRHEGATVGLWNDNDDTNTRVDLNLAFTKDFYGAKVGLRSDDFAQTKIGIYNAYVWAGFLNDVLGIKFGLIDDSAWATEGDEEFHYSTGGGLRLEVKPIEGLNVGVLLTLPGGKALRSEYWSTTPDVGNQSNWQNADGIDTSGNNIWLYNAPGPESVFSTRFKYFLPETSLGAKYESALFNVAAGVKFDGAGDGLDVAKPLSVSAAGGDYKGLLGGDDFAKNALFATKAFGEDSDGDSFLNPNAGLSTYFGVSVKAIENLTAAVELQWYNAAAKYAKAGYIWLDEVLAYNLGKLGVGATLTQYFYGKRILYTDNNNFSYVDGNGNFSPVQADNAETSLTIHPYLKFAPWVSYQIFDPLTAKLEVGYATQKNIINYDIWLKPSVTYKLGDNAKIVGSYKYDLEKDSNVGYGNYGTTGSAENIWTHTVQINLDWSF